MNGVCTKCGLPQELCVCEIIAKESQHIKVYTVKRRFGKIYTLIEGFDSREINLRSVTKKLKAVLACGGTLKDGVIELQGDHRKNAVKQLTSLGFSEGTIEVKWNTSSGRNSSARR